MEGEKQQPGVVLLNCSASPFNNRVGNALTRKGVAYEKKLENLPAISPLLFSSNPILAQILVWRSPAGAAGLAAIEGSKGLVAVLRTLEVELGGRRYIGDESLSYVDMALVKIIRGSRTISTRPRPAAPPRTLGEKGRWTFRRLARRLAGSSFQNRIRKRPSKRIRGLMVSARSGYSLPSLSFPCHLPSLWLTVLPPPTLWCRSPHTGRIERQREVAGDGESAAKGSSFSRFALREPFQNVPNTEISKQSAAPAASTRGKQLGFLLRDNDGF
ncbi:hypothetical protein GUJ93_ZPchr0012g19704 [Zizania palustris]|uniref:GST N-terminal domain-containing protein n=1 Tax=Zizania palustris TaxID=103762 RepID=A0A8J5WSZ1_ZIZPA|nr:hypothetical protein GUJ93_ZPchr0012g19704 [Zizania palustris]